MSNDLAFNMLCINIIVTQIEKCYSYIKCEKIEKDSLIFVEIY